MTPEVVHIRPMRRTLVPLALAAAAFLPATAHACQPESCPPPPVYCTGVTGPTADKLGLCPVWY